MQVTLSYSTDGTEGWEREKCLGHLDILGPPLLHSASGVSWPYRTCGISNPRRLTEASCSKDGSTPKNPSCAPTNWSRSSLKSGACKHVWSSLCTRSGQKKKKKHHLCYLCRLDCCQRQKRFIFCSKIL